MDGFVSGVRRQVGWFVILGFGAITLILLTLSMRTDIFAKKFYLDFSPPSAAAFYVGQQVKFQGFTIGRIGDMDLRDDGTVTIRLHLLERYHSMLHEGSTVRLIRDGLIGEQTVEITAGDTSRPVVRDGQSIHFEFSASIEQLMQEVKPAIDNANILLQELVVLAQWMNDPGNDIRQVSARLNELSQDLNRENVREVVSSFTRVLADLQALTGTLQEQHIAEELSASLQATTKSSPTCSRCRNSSPDRGRKALS